MHNDVSGLNPVLENNNSSIDRDAIYRGIGIILLRNSDDYSLFVARLYSRSLMMPER